MNDKKIFLMISSPDEDLAILGCSVLGRKGKTETTEFFEKYGYLELSHINEALPFRIRRKGGLRGTILNFGDFQIHLYDYTVWMRIVADLKPYEKYGSLIINIL